MPIILALIAEVSGHKVLVEHFDGTYANCSPGNIKEVARKVLSKVNSTTLATSGPKMSFCYENHAVHWMLFPTTAFLCVTDMQTQKTVSFAFLQELCGRFQKLFPEGSRMPEQWKVSLEMTPVVEALVTEMNSGGALSKGQRAKNAIEEVKGQMMDNIEKVIERNEQIESIVDKSEELSERCSLFRQTPLPSLPTIVTFVSSHTDTTSSPQQVVVV